MRLPLAEESSWLMSSRAGLSPWTMGMSYGAGQVLVAVILFFAAAEADHEA
jgi:hypothetical protein